MRWCLGVDMCEERLVKGDGGERILVLGGGTLLVIGAWCWWRCRGCNYDTAARGADPNRAFVLHKLY